MKARNIQVKNLLFLLLFIVHGYAQAVEQKEIIIDSSGFDSRSNQFLVSWWINGLNGQAVSDENINLFVDDKLINVKTSLEPERGQSICYMLLVDTSRSMLMTNNRLNTKPSALIKLLKGIVTEKPSQHFIGLMTFAKTSKLLVSPTKNIDEVLIELEKINFDESRTELFRFLEDGIKKLKEKCDSSAYRNIIILFTDGLAEDSAFDEVDAVKFALEYKTTIYSIVTKDSKAVQIPFYLAEKTGGWGLQVDDLYKEIYLNIYNDSNSGGTLKVILSDKEPIKNISLKMVISDETLTENIPFVVPITPHWKRVIIRFLPWLKIEQTPYVIVLFTYLILILMLLAWKLYRKNNQKIFKKHKNIIGFLVHQGDSYPVFAGINTLGYLPTNDIVIKEDTVGRTHATLHYQGDGEVIINDLKSLNGSYLNGHQLQMPTIIKDGDQLRFGSWNAIFQRIKRV